MSIVGGRNRERPEDFEPVAVFKPPNRPWRAYGMSDEEFGAMYRQQGGRCAICHEDRQLNVDHDHETGKVRALLCRRCNVVLGFLHDEPELAELIVEYLERHG